MKVPSGGAFIILAHFNVRPLDNRMAVISFSHLSLVSWWNLGNACNDAVGCYSLVVTSSHPWSSCGNLQPDHWQMCGNSSPALVNNFSFHLTINPRVLWLIVLSVPHSNVSNVCSVLWISFLTFHLGLSKSYVKLLNHWGVQHVI